MDFLAEALFARRLGQRARRQVQINELHLIRHSSVDVRGDKRHRQAFPVGLIATVVLDFDVEVETALRAIDLLAALIRTNERSVDFFGRPAHVLLSYLVLLGLVACQLVALLLSTRLRWSLCVVHGQVARGDFRLHDWVQL